VARFIGRVSEHGFLELCPQRGRKILASLIGEMWAAMGSTGEERIFHRILDGRRICALRARNNKSLYFKRVRAGFGNADIDGACGSGGGFSMDKQIS
jgi:hypothetical protein